MSNATNRQARFPKTATFLCDHSTEDGGDPPIPIEKAAQAWQDFEPLARSVVKQTLAKLPLSQLRDQLEEAGVPVRRGSQTVRDLLARDPELVADLVQDVAVAFVRAVRRGAIRAARPVVYSWIVTTTARITREKSRADAISLLSGAYLSEAERKSEDDGPRAPEPTPMAGVGGRPLNEHQDSDEHSDIRTQLREVLFAAAPANLTNAQQLVFTRWVQGASHREIAEELGITERAVRLRLMKARRRLAA